MTLHKCISNVHRYGTCSECGQQIQQSEVKRDETIHFTNEILHKTILSRSIFLKKTIKIGNQKYNFDECTRNGEKLRRKTNSNYQ